MVDAPTRLQDDSYTLPRVDDRNAKSCKIPRVTRYHSKIVFQSRRGNEAVHHLEWPPLQLTLSGEYAPPFGNRLAHRQDTDLQTKAAMSHPATVAVGCGACFQKAA